MGKHSKNKGKGSPVPVNPVLDVATVTPQTDSSIPPPVTGETPEEVTAVLVVDPTPETPETPSATAFFRAMIREAMVNLTKASGVDYLDVSKSMTEEAWLAWASETVPEVQSVKVLTIRMEGHLIGQQAKIRDAQPDKRGGDQTSNTATPQTPSEKQVATKLQLIADNPEAFEAYCAKQASLSKPVSVSGAATAIRAVKAKAEGKQVSTEGTNARRERLNENALAELAARETAFQSIPEVISFAKERLTMILIASEGVTDSQISEAILRSQKAVQIRADRAKELHDAAQLAANQAANANAKQAKGQAA